MPHNLNLSDFISKLLYVVFNVTKEEPVVAPAHHYSFPSIKREQKDNEVLFRVKNQTSH